MFFFFADCLLITSLYNYFKDLLETYWKGSLLTHTACFDEKRGKQYTVKETPTKWKEIFYSRIQTHKLLMDKITFERY